MKKETTRFVAGIITGAVLFSGTAAYAAGIMAEHAPQTAYVDGAPVQLDAYNIGGYNYVKLRDIGQAVGFNVYWDGQSVRVDSDASYTGTAPAVSVSGGQAGITLTDNLEIRMEMIQLINQVRRENGAAELPINDALMNAAQITSSKLYTTHHNREECETAMACGYPYGFANNLTVFSCADSASIARMAVDNWIRSPGHFRAMIDPRCDSIGAGVTISGGRAYCQMYAGDSNSSHLYG